MKPLPLITAIAQVAPFASQDETRKFIQPVTVDSDKVWATNGYQLVIIDQVKIAAGDVGRYLNGKRMEDPPDAPNAMDVYGAHTTPPEVCDLSESDIKTLSTWRSIIAKRVGLEVHFTKHGVVRLNGHNSRKRESSEISATIPMAPTVQHDFAVNLRMLLDAIDVMDLEGGCTLHQDADPLRPIVVVGAKGRAITMPLRL